MTRVSAPKLNLTRPRKPVAKPKKKPVKGGLKITRPKKPVAKKPIAKKPIAKKPKKGKVVEKPKRVRKPKQVNESTQITDEDLKEIDNGDRP